MDNQSVRLLLDYKADPNILFKNMSLLTFAVRTGNFVAIKMLLDAKADLNLGDPVPLESLIHYSSRESLAALLDGHESALLVPIKGKLLVEMALEEKVTLLSVIAVYTKRQFDEAKKSGDGSNLPVFPPKTLKRSHLKKLNAALKQNDYLLPVDIVRKSAVKVKSPWRPLSKDTGEESEIIEALNTSMNLSRSRGRAGQIGNLEEYKVPPTPFKYNESENNFDDLDDSNEVSHSTVSNSYSMASRPAFNDTNEFDDIDPDMRFHLMTPTSSPRTTAKSGRSPFAES